MELLWKQQQGGMSRIKRNLQDMQLSDVLYNKGLRMTLESKHRSVSQHVQPMPGRYEFIPVKEVDGIREMAFFDHVCVTRSEERITVKRWVNMNSQDTERPLTEAVRREAVAREK